MNATKFMFLLIFSIIFYSCDSNELKSSDTEKIESVLNLKGESQKIAFKMLSAENKYDLWLNKLNLLVELGGLNDSQRAFVQELIGTLKVEYFDDNAVQNNPVYYNEYLSEMKIIGSILFTKKQMLDYFGSIDSLTKVVLVGSGGCGCSAGDDWCIGSSSCFVWSCERHTGCGW